jgi:hypothetical protein
MCSANQIYVVFDSEFAHDGLAKRKRYTAVVVSVLLDAALWVWPEQVAQQARIGHVRRSNYTFDLLEVFQFRAQSAVHAQNFLVDDCAHGQTVKDVWEYFPEFDRVSSFTFIVKAINTVDLSTLVVAAEEEKVFRELDLITEEQSYSFDWLLAAVNVIAEEEVVCLGGESSVFKNP